MIAVLAFVLAAADIRFAQQEVPGVHVYAVNPLSGAAATNFRHADLDENGEQDLILPRSVYFNRDNGLDTQNPLVLPRAAEQPYCDLWGAEVYLLFADRLWILRWEEGDWETVLDQEVAWPRSDDPGASLFPEEEPGVRFKRFLHDFEGDGVPEIVIASDDGLHVYRRAKSGYASAACLDVFPPLRLAEMPQSRLWPEAKRKITLPAREMACWLFLDTDALTVVNQEDLPGMRLRYRMRRYTLDPENGYAPVEDATRDTVTEPMPNYLRPCRLNEDDVIDYAGGDWEVSAATLLPVPIYETCATTDGAATFHTVRTISLRPKCSFVDYDGDGDLDMVTEATDLFQGGVRETVSRFVSCTRVRHGFAVHLQDARQRLSDAPDLQTRTAIVLDAPPFRNTELFRRYQSGELADITGDFNGDGYRDLVAQVRPEHLAVFVGSVKGFASKPAATIRTLKNRRFGIADVDGDGLSDIVICWYDYATEKVGEHCYVYFARERKQ